MLLYRLISSLLFAPLALFGHSFRPHPADILAIQRPITQYATALDSKDFAKFSTVFTEDLFADYTTAVSTFHSLSEIQSAFPGFLQTLRPTTQSINQLSKARAEAQTYVIAMYFGKPSTASEGQMIGCKLQRQIEDHEWWDAEFL